MPFNFTQTGRLLAVRTPLPDDTLLADHMMLTERLSHPFSLELDLKSPREKASQVKSAALIGKPMSLEVRLGNGSDVRHIHGVCRQLTQVGRDERFFHYRTEIVPWVWLMSLDTDCRIFQDKTVPEILHDVFMEWQGKFKDLVRFRVNAEDWHVKLDYCVQYRESDFNFVSRLMEQEGMYYFFEHKTDAHTLVVVDSHDQHNTAVPGQETARLSSRAKNEGNEDVVTSMEIRRSIVPGKAELRDYNFQIPDQKLVHIHATNHNVGGNNELELYNYPGEYAQRYNKPDERIDELFYKAPGAALAEMIIGASDAGHVVASGTSTCRAFLPGHKFKLVDAQGQDLDIDGAGCEYLITSVRHTADQYPDYDSGVAGEPYRNSFTCIPQETQFRPARSTPKPFVQGLQSAVVVGEKNQEITVDKYGRVKVQFHWDRLGEKNENSSCWLRVSQISAGTNWGAFFWPRIGHEVLVAFLEGDPDEPIVVGSVYNYKNMPPYTLPEHKTRSGIKTRSTLKGYEQHFNELRFEDKKGAEEIYVHAEREMNRVVENNDTVKIGHSGKSQGNQTTDIFNSQYYTVGAQGCKEGCQLITIWDSQYITIGGGGSDAANGNQSIQIWNDQNIDVGAGQGANAEGSQYMRIYKHRQVDILTGNDRTTISQGNQTTTLEMGNQTTILKTGNQTTKLDLGSSTIEAMQSIELKVGGSSIKVDQTGVTIKGMMIKVEGTTMTEVKGLMTTVNGSAMLTAKGGLTMIN